MKLLEILRTRSADPVLTRLELARAFADLGDTELARHYLDEVMEDGSEELQRSAASLITSLPA